MLGEIFHNWQKIILSNTIAAFFSDQICKGISEYEVYFEDGSIMFIEVYRKQFTFTWFFAAFRYLQVTKIAI